MSSPPSVPLINQSALGPNGSPSTSGIVPPPAGSLNQRNVRYVQGQNLSRPFPTILPRDLPAHNIPRTQGVSSEPGSPTETHAHTRPLLSPASGLSHRGNPSFGFASIASQDSAINRPHAAAPLMPPASGLSYQTSPVSSAFIEFPEPHNARRNDSNARGQQHVNLSLTNPETLPRVPTGANLGRRRVPTTPPSGITPTQSRGFANPGSFLTSQEIPPTVPGHIPSVPSGSTNQVRHIPEPIHNQRRTAFATTSGGIRLGTGETRRVSQIIPPSNSHEAPRGNPGVRNWTTTAWSIFLVGISILAVSSLFFLFLI